MKLLVEIEQIHLEVAPLHLGDRESQFTALLTRNIHANIPPYTDDAHGLYHASLSGSLVAGAWLTSQLRLEVSTQQPKNNVDIDGSRERWMTAQQNYARHGRLSKNISALRSGPEGENNDVSTRWAYLYNIFINS